MTARTEERRWGRAPLLSVGARLRILREAMGYNPKQLCECIAMTHGQLSEIERGIKSLSLRRAFQLWSLFGPPVESVVCQVLQDKLAEAGFRHLRVRIELIEDEPSGVHRARVAEPPEKL